MSENLVVYTVIHQPRRLRLPAKVIPPGTPIDQLPEYLFDEEMDRRYFEKVAKYSYRPATAMFQRMVKLGWRMGIGFSDSFLRQAEMWGPDVIDAFKELTVSRNVEVVNVEPYHSWICYFDIEAFKANMTKHQKRLEALFGKPVRVTDTTEMFMSNDVYYALQQCGFDAAIMEGRPWQLGWQDPTYLYKQPGGKMGLLCRHHELSDDVGYRFSNQSWSEYPLNPEHYADWLRGSWGDVLTIGWDYETFGEHHREDSGIFEFMPKLQSALKGRGVRLLTPSQAISEFATKSRDMVLNEYGTTWAGDGGMEFFLGNSAQQGIFRLMHHVYSKARLTNNPKLLEIATWLLQSDNLHLIQWFSRWGPEAEVSAYFTPDEWWELGALGILREQQRVYQNFIRAMDPYC